MTNQETTATTTTLLLTSGAAIKLRNAFIFGNGIAGSLSDGSVRWFNDNEIERVAA